MILFIDHFDSFSNNLIGWFESKGLNFQKITCDKLLSIHNFDDIKAVIFSPGPGHPSQYNESLNLYKRIPYHIPFLGVCLGHQLLLMAEGGVISQINKKPMHGRQIQVKPSNFSKYFKNSELHGRFVLYNSLGCKISDPIFSKNMVALASENGFVIATEHCLYPRIGIQFHPESFASPAGFKVLNTFLRLIKC
jgi:anthranilate/para-aminobenzoate synthase component II